MRLTSWLWGFMVLGLLGVITVTKAQDDVEDVDVDDMEEEVLDTEAEEDVEEEVKPPAIERAAYIKPVPRGNTYFTETFDSDDEFYDQWVLSEAKKEDAEEDIAKYDGRWSIEEPKENPLIGDLGLVLKSKAKHHAVSSRLKRPFEFKGKPFVVQYEVKFQNGQECGGAYMKLLTKDSKLSLTQFVDKTPYTIMFGPDKCGNDNKLHFIFRHKNPKTGESEEKHAKKPTAAIDGFFTDKKTHLYTLIVNPDNSFEIFVDLNLVNSGSLLEDFEPPVNPPKEIVDPDDKKPKDWDEREKIADPEAKKPEDWDEDEPEMITDADAEKPTGWLDDETELIPDPDAEKPSDWDEDMDGEWEAPMISNPACESVPGCGEWVPPQIKNPAYKGKWKAPMIDNPDYRGKWKPRKIDNPDYFEDLEPYKMLAIEAVGLELWSMSDDIYFDNFIITDSKDVADRWAADTWELKHMSEEAGSSAVSVVRAIMDATQEKPWLWAVFIVVVVLPVVLFIVYCCMSSPASPGIIAGLLQAADERKWLYAVYAVVVLLPVVFCVSMFRKSGSQPDEDPAARRKKTDEPDEDNATDDAKQAADGSGDATQEPADSKKKPSKSDLEAEDANEADGEDEGETSERRTSPRKRKTKPQKEQ